MEVDLSRFRRRLIIGGKGDVKVAGAGVVDRHAEIFREPGGTESIRPLGGEVWVIHGQLRELVTRPHQLADGDVIVVGNWQLRYRSLLARRQQQKDRSVAWIR